MTAAGVVVGLGAALLGSCLLVALLFDVSRVDPVTLVGVCATLIAVSIVSAYLPARRATRIDPTRALLAD